MNEWNFIKEDFVEMVASRIERLREAGVPESQLGQAAIAVAISEMSSKMPELFWHEASISGLLSRSDLDASEVGSGDLAHAVRKVARAIETKLGGQGDEG